MKQMQIIIAVRAIDEILEKNPVIKPMAVSYALFKLRRKLQEHWEWQAERENSIKADIATMGLTEEEAQKRFDELLGEIVLTDVEQDWDIVQIPANSEITIHPKQFASLVGFIEIV